MGVATILDPRYKMELLEFYFESIYPLDFFPQVNRIRNLCYDLVLKYQAKEHEDFTSSFRSSDFVSDGLSKLCDYDRYIERKKEASTSTMKTELDHYLEEEVLPRSSDFDILIW